MKTYCYSYNEEIFHGRFATAEEAWNAAWGADDVETAYVGECVAPSQPELWWNAEDWLEHVSCQDEYSNEWAEDWDRSSKAQRTELEAEVRSVMAAWLDRHNLRPMFYNVENVKERTRPAALKEQADAK